MQANNCYYTVAGLRSLSHPVASRRIVRRNRSRSCLADVYAELSMIKYTSRGARSAVKSLAKALCTECSLGRILGTHCRMSGMSPRHTTCHTQLHWSTGCKV